MKKNTALSIIGYIIYSPEQFIELSEKITPEMFGGGILTDTAHQIWNGFSQKGIYTPADLRDWNEVLAGEALKHPATGANIDHAIQSLRTVYEKNEAVRIYKEAARLAIDNDIFAALSHAETEMEHLQKMTAPKDDRLETIRESYEMTFKMMNRDTQNQVTGVNTGFQNLNDHTAGWQPKTMVVIAARPGMGKTTYTLQGCLAAARLGHEVIYFTCGDTGSEGLYQKAACILADVDPGNLRRNFLTEDDKQRIAIAYGEISSLPITIIDGSTWNGNVGGIRDIVKRKARAWQKTGIVVVDYIQQVEPERMVQPRIEQIRLVSAGLQRLAKQVNCPVIAISQLSRAIEGTNREPMLSDLRGSGDIEQDADQVFFIWETDVDDKPTRLMLCKKDRQGGLINQAARMEFIDTKGRYKWIYDTPFDTNVINIAAPSKDEMPF